MEDQEVIKEFLIESSENLGRMDREIVELERNPGSPELLSSIFRTIHTIKGTCGFLGFGNLESIAHLAENILSQLRNRERDLQPSLASLILETIDVIRRILAQIEATGSDNQNTHEDLRARLAAALSAAEVRQAPQRAAAQAQVSVADNPSSKGPAASDSSIRVDVGLLDKLMNLVGELVLARNQILQFNAQQDVGTLNSASQRLNLITTELQEGVMKTRMQPIGVVWNKLPRLVRDLSVNLGKQVRLHMEGVATELDKTIIEAIKDPLTHIVRNCCDHGIETPPVRTAKGKSAAGTIELRAFHEGGQVNIEISDDGAGIDIAGLKEKAVQRGVLRAEQAQRMTDREALNLIFAAGVTTAAAVTSISGRGVGMDVVKTNIEKIGGIVDVTSQPGAGTTIRLKIPLTLAIIPGLIVLAGERRSAPRKLAAESERFLIPQVSLLELIRLDGAAAEHHVERIHGTPVYRRRGRLLPIVYLNEVLGLGSAGESSVSNIVVLQAEEKQFGLVVDGIADTQEIVVKPLGKQFKGMNCYAGATILGDGKVALILDVLGIGQRAGVLTDVTEESNGGEHSGAALHNERQAFLLFSAGMREMLAVPLALVARLEEFPQSRIERSGTGQVVQYRGRILPLVSLGAILDPDSPGSAAQQDPVQVIVFDQGEHSVGVLVDHILDIAEEQVTVRQASARKGTLGSAVIGRRVVDLVDVRAVMQAASEQFQEVPARTNAATVLIADKSQFNRALVRSDLEMSGYRVVEAADKDEALRQVHRNHVDAVVAAAEGAGVPEWVRTDATLGLMPALVLPEGSAREDREEMLRSLEKLGNRVAGPAEVVEQEVR